MGRRCESFGRKGICERLVGSSKRVKKMQVDGMRRETGRGEGKETQGYDFEGFMEKVFRCKD